MGQGKHPNGFLHWPKVSLGLRSPTMGLRPPGPEPPAELVKKEDSQTPDSIYWIRSCRNETLDL